MEDGTASRTARSVAAHRLEFERVAAVYGDPAETRPGCVHAEGVGMPGLGVQQ